MRKRDIINDIKKVFEDLANSAEAVGKYQTAKILRKSRDRALLDEANPGKTNPKIPKGWRLV